MFNSSHEGPNILPDVLQELVLSPTMQKFIYHDKLNTPDLPKGAEYVAYVDDMVSAREENVL